MIKKILAVLCLCASAWATTSVTGNVKNLGTGSVSAGTFVRFYLRGCSGNQPRINGTGIIAPTLGNVFYFDFVPNSSGAISGTLYSTRDAAGTGNGEIECGGSFTSVWYGMVVFQNGKAGPETPIHAKNTATIDVSNITPITTNPVVTAPTGDSTYARLDVGNTPFTGTVQAPSASITGALTAGSVTSGSYDTTTINVARQTGADFGAQFNNAVTACGTGHCILWIPPSTTCYNETTQAQIVGLTYVTVQGGGAGATCINNRVTGTPAASAILINNSDQIRVTGLNISGTASTGHAITVEATDGTAGHGGIYIDHNRLGDSTGNGVDHASVSTAACGLYVWNVNAVTTEYNSYFGNQHGICLDNTGSPPTNTNIFTSIEDRISSSVGDAITQNGTAFQTRFYATQCEANGGWCGNFSSMNGGGIEKAYMEGNTSGGVQFTSGSANFSITDAFCSQATTGGPCVKSSATIHPSGMKLSGLTCNVTSASGTLTDCVTVDWSDSIIENVTALVQQAGATLTNVVTLATGSTDINLRSISKHNANVGTITNLLNDTVASVLLTGASSFPYIRGINYNLGSTDAGLLQRFTNGNAQVASNGTGKAEFNFSVGTGTGGTCLGNGNGTCTCSHTAAGFFSCAGTITSNETTGTAPFASTSTTPIPHVTTVPATYNAAGTQQTEAHIVEDTCTLATNCGITLSGSAAFTSATTYSCSCHDQTTPANACNINQTGGGGLTITGTGTDVIRYLCVGN